MAPNLGRSLSTFWYYEIPDRLQKRNFQGRSSLHPVSVWYAQPRDLSSTFERQPRAISIAFIVLGVTWITLTNSLSWGGFSCLVLELLLGS